MKFLHRNKNKIDQDKAKAQNVPANFDDFYYEEIAKMAAAGGWGINFVEKKSYIDPQGRRILNIPDEYNPKPKSALIFYAADNRTRAEELFNSCSKGESFCETLKMLTYDKKEFWARAYGEPLYDNGKIIGIHGVFQDITSEKLKEISLENSLHLIQSQNSKLYNFAHIVSHNLRSHSSNLQLTLELLKSIDAEEEKIELMDGLDKISISLNETINHLNEIVNTQAKADDEQVEINFEEVLNNVKNTLSRQIQDSKAEIYHDFSLVPSIKYVPAYIDSIFLNLITNSIKYKHPDRNPKIQVQSYDEAGVNYVVFKDNGLGIDLDLYGDKLFNMYQTFHNHKDAVGIGLFITKNQVEALKGTITVESTVDEGSSFTIQFN